MANTVKTTSDWMSLFVGSSRSSGSYTQDDIDFLDSLYLQVEVGSVSADIHHTAEIQTMILLLQDIPPDTHQSLHPTVPDTPG